MLENGKNKGEAEKKSIIESSQEEIAKMIVLGAEKVLRAK
jgi:F0F1-type ATP synthase membrane subunit b/b'